MSSRYNWRAYPRSGVPREKRPKVRARSIVLLDRAHQRPAVDCESIGLHLPRRVMVLSNGVDREEQCLRCGQRFLVTGLGVEFELDNEEERSSLLRFLGLREEQQYG